ncbi:hypothetical protein Ahy_A07g036494 isoform B [Arachis hypogaea]|uniref:Uncharacterized protein n=1 Tax=Arachis hypogaea TaxID=3818 RepID=A0A445CGC8_ARAHY|nr:hypothetical protein Ahy_A07g036494 isoform B [Arachis hypogaea]
MQKELQELKLQYKKLKIEHSLFHDIADKMIEEKDNEISRFSDDNRNLRQSLQSRPQVDHSDNDNYNTGINSFISWKKLFCLLSFLSIFSLFQISGNFLV